MNKTIKRVIAGVITVTLVVGGIAGGMVVYRNMSKKPVKVFAATDFTMSDYWGDSSQSGGMVKTEGMQQITTSSTQKVTRIYVSEGQKVKAGDKILEYDSTLSTLEVTRAEIAVKKQELQLDNLKQELAEIKKMKPFKPNNNGGGGGGNVGPVFPPIPPAPQPQDTRVVKDDPVYVSGTGSLADPQRFICPENYVFSQDRLRDFYSGKAMEITLESLGQDEPLIPEQPSESETPSEGEEPSEEVTPSESEEVSESEAPSEIEEPSESETPSESEKTSESETPSEGGEPSEEVNPSESEEVSESEAPSESEETSESENSSESGAPAGGDTSSEGGASAEEGQPIVTPAPGGKEEPVYIVLEYREGDCVSGSVIRTIGMVLASQGEEILFSFFDPSAPADFDPNQEIALGSVLYSMPVADMVLDMGGGYTAAEIAQMRNNKEKEIRDLELSLKIAHIDLEKKKTEINDTAIYAELDGVVQNVMDPDEAFKEGKPVASISAGGGYYITGAISEMELGSVQPGQSVNVMAWESGVSCQGEIREISPYPNDNANSWSDGNTNVSYYPFTVYVDASAGLKEYEYVQLEYSPAQGSHGLYLESSFIRKENGKNFIYVLGEDNKLKKVDIVTGKSIWGSYTEVKAGLSPEDYIAFPYGDAEDGAAAVIAESQELYQ